MSDDITWKILAAAMFTVLCGVVAWLWSWNSRRHDGHDTKFDRNDTRFREIEFTSVTRNTLNRFASDWRDEITNVRVDIKDRHTENRDWQKRMEDKLDIIVANMPGGIRAIR